MKIYKLALLFLPALVILLISSSSKDSYRPGLFFREDWKEIPAAIPVTQEHVNNPELLLNLYGNDADSIKKSHHEKPVDDPYYIWSGLTKDNWAVTLRHQQFNADLTGYAKIRWRSKQQGFRELRILLKLSDGTWLVSDQSDGASKDWRIKEFNIMDINWYTINIERITEVKKIENPDLTDVEEIGFTDLMRGGLSSACSRLDWIEVYAEPVSR